jgi:hypothetical protein
MVCDIDLIKEKNIKLAKKAFIGNAITFKEKPNGIIWMPKGKFSIQQLYEIARKNALRVGKWASEKFGNKFSDNWVYYNELKDGLEILIDFPKKLEQAYLKKIEKDQLDEQARAIQEQDAKRAGLEYTDDYLFGMEETEKQITPTEERVEEEIIEPSFEISYKRLLNLKPSTDITEEDWRSLTPEEQNQLIDQAQNC